MPGGKNLGLVATRFIKAGELIISEKPPFVLNLLNLDEDTYMDDGVTQQSALSLLTPQRREGYLSLHNCFGDEYPLTSGILRTNYLPVDVTPTPNVDDPCGVKGIFPHLCRANHSCSPNASYFFDVTTFSGQFWAARDIQPNEEICIQYTWALKGRDRRREVGQEYFRFTCQCSTCTLPEAESKVSDVRRLFIEELLPNVESPALADDKLAQDATIEQVEQAAKYAKEEGLFHFVGRIRFAGAKLLLQQQRWVEAEALGKEAKEAFFRCQGPSSYNVQACDGFLQDIRAHASN